MSQHPELGTYRRSIRHLDNVGYIDRSIRVALAFVLFGGVFSYAGEQPNLGWASLAAFAAFYPIVTAILGVDPVYRLLGIDTSRGIAIPSDGDITAAADRTYDKFIAQKLVPPSASKQEKINTKDKAA